MTQFHFFGTVASQVLAPTYEAESIALFAAMAVQPTDARKTLIDNLIFALKANGVWAKLDLFYMGAVATIQQSSLNWKTPGSYSLSGSGTFTADRGWTFNGTSEKYDTGFNPATAVGRLQTQTSASIAAYMLPKTTTLQNAIGNTNLGLQTRLSNVQTGKVNSTIASGTGGGTANDRGFTIFARSDTSNQTGYNRNTVTATIGGPTTTGVNVQPVTSGNFFLGGTNSATQFSTTEIRMAMFGMAIDSSAWASTYSAILTYMTAVGAQI